MVVGVEDLALLAAIERLVVDEIGLQLWSRHDGVTTAVKGIAL